MGIVRSLRLAHLVISLQVRMTISRGVPIDIFNQDGSDIAPPYKNDVNVKGVRGNMYTAIHRESIFKWKLKAGDDYIIPYTITGQYGTHVTQEPNELEMFKKVMEHIHDKTCIRFKQRKNEKDFVEIENDPGGGCFTPRILLHELLHVIGLWHEHMRYDRDDYITVHYDNVQKRYWGQFEKLSPHLATTYDIPYDYKSIMHYAKTSFANPGTDVIGHAKTATPSDYLKVCKIYECARCLGGNISNSISNSNQNAHWLDWLTGGSLPNTNGAVFVFVISLFHFWRY